MKKMLGTKRNKQIHCYSDKSHGNVIDTDTSTSFQNTNIDSHISDATTRNARLSNVNTISASHPRMWSISYDQLLQFDEKASTEFGVEYASKNMHDIKPICRQEGKSYALNLNRNGLKVDAFITHSWNEPFAEFVKSIKHVFHTRATGPNLWICSFALTQGGDKVKCQLGLQDRELNDVPFVKALESASCYVVVRNCRSDLYSRIWCVCELMYARKFGLLPNETYVNGPDAFANSQTSCLDARATQFEDRERVLKVLLNKFEPKEVDNFIRQFQMQEAPDPLLTWQHF